MYAATAIRDIARDDEVPDSVKAQLLQIANDLEQQDDLSVLHTRADELRKSDSSLSPARAMELAMETAEGRAAYARVRP